MLNGVAIRTWFSPLEGACSPAQWAAHWGAELPAQVVLADRETMAGLPAARQAWGAERVIPGMSLCAPQLSPAEATADHDMVLIPRSAAGYAQLCQWLSWRHEQPDRYRRWWDGGRSGPSLSGVVVALRHGRWAALFATLGAGLRWRLERSDEEVGAGFEPLLLPLIDHRDGHDRMEMALRQAVAQRERRVWIAATGWDQLATTDACCSTLAAASRDCLTACYRPPTGVWHMPPSSYDDAAAELRQRAEVGFQARYGQLSVESVRPVRKRLEHELSVIIAKGFAGYLLCVDDLARGRRTCGRGSGASSLVVYCLGITHVDPWRYGLLFERFLNHARSDPPDLDVDFPWDERDAVLADALRRYGSERVAMVANHCYLRRWSALRVVARAYGQGNDEINAMVRSLRAARRYGQGLSPPEPWPGIIAAAAALEDRPHHHGLHCGGVVITPQPIRSLVPVHLARKQIAIGDDADADDEPGPGPQLLSLPVIDWEKDGAEAMGLVKIDLLGNRSLAVIRDSLADLAADGITIDELRWQATDDPLTRELVASGNTMGCFYIESPAMRQLQAKAASPEFDALVIHSSIIRPAANRWIGTYLQRLHDYRQHGVQRDEWYPHPCLRHLLSDSFGILSYQEDVMQVAVAMAGFDERQANALRKALGHWGTEAGIDGFATAFRAGALARGAAPAIVDQVWDMIASFAGYSFCKAHSASYAMVSFQCAWLKAHFPAYFLARVIANEGGFYRPAAYLEEARRCGVRILGPCVVHSQWSTQRASAGAIRCGLHLLPGISAHLGQRLLHCRTQRPFAGIEDLRCRLGLGAGTLDMLARAGALDALHPHYHRGQVLWLARSLGLRPRHQVAAEGLAQQTTLLPLEPSIDPPVPELPRPSEESCERAQLAVLAFLPGRHPLSLLPLGTGMKSCAQAAALAHGQRVTVQAQVITRKQVMAQAGPRHPGRGVQAMSFVTIEDPSGILETVWFPEVYQRYGPLLETAHALIIRGVIAREFSVPTLTVERVGIAGR